MAYKIVCDSCTDLPEAIRKDSHICLVPLAIHVDEHEIIDDETFNQMDLIQKMKVSSSCPKSSCPSPDLFMKHYGGDEDIYVITLSSKLSGSYNSACLAKDLYLEDHPHKNIHVIDSKSASVGQALIAMKLMELCEQGLEFAKITKEIENYRDSIETKFLLESFDILRKNGRLSNIQAILVNALNIKPIMGATPEGSIMKVDQARGMKRALPLLAKIVAQEAKDAKNRILGIAHCNNVERAELLKHEIMQLTTFKDVLIVNTAGVSTLYANEGGVIVCY